MDGVMQHEDGEYQVTTTWGTITWLAGHAMGSADTIGMARVLLKRGHASRRHAHPNCEEVIYLLQGTIHCSLGSASVELAPRETLCIAPGVFHHYANTGGEDAEMIVVYGAGDRQLVMEEPL